MSRFGAGPVFSTGGWIHVDVLRDGAVPPAALAASVGLELNVFLEELEAWAEGIGLPYGVRVHREAGTITTAGAEEASPR